MLTYKLKCKLEYILIQKRCFANSVFYRKIERSQTDCVGDLEEPL